VTQTADLSGVMKELIAIKGEAISRRPSIP